MAECVLAGKTLNMQFAYLLGKHQARDNKHLCVWACMAAAVSVWKDKESAGLGS